MRCPKLFTLIPFLLAFLYCNANDGAFRVKGNLHKDYQALASQVCLGFMKGGSGLFKDLAQQRTS